MYENDSMEGACSLVVADSCVVEAVESSFWAMHLASWSRTDLSEAMKSRQQMRMHKIVLYVMASAHSWYDSEQTSYRAT